MVKVNYGGRFGNNLCQYILGRIIAEELQFALEVPDRGYDFLKNIAGQRHDKPVEYYGGHILDLNKIINDKRARKIVFLDGYFQRYEYYKPYRKKIKKWFNFDSYPCRRPTSEKNVVLHIRGGDLWQNKKDRCQHSPVPLRYYQKVLQDTEYDEAWIVKEPGDDPIVNRLSTMYPDMHVISQSVISDFLFMHHASTIALSMSTMSWWAAWLSEAKTIHLPLYGFWHPKSYRQDIDMRVDNEDRYVEHDLEAFDSWTGTPEQMNNLLREL